MTVESSGATFDEVAYQSSVQMMQEEFAMIGSLVGLHGVLVILSLLSIYALITQCRRKTRFTTTILSSTIFALFFSTTVYAVTWLLFTQTGLLRYLVISVSFCGPTVISIRALNRCSGSKTTRSSTIARALLHLRSTCVVLLDILNVQYHLTHTCSSYITLGDAIVCWRACVVWHGNRAVRAVCAVLLFATFGGSLALLTLFTVAHILPRSYGSC